MTLAQFPGEDVSAFATHAQKKILILMSDFALPIDLGIEVEPFGLVTRAGSSLPPVVKRSSGSRVRFPTSVIELSAIEMVPSEKRGVRSRCSIEVAYAAEMSPRRVASSSGKRSNLWRNTSSEMRNPRSTSSIAPPGATRLKMA